MATSGASTGPEPRSDIGTVLRSPAMSGALLAVFIGAIDLTVIAAILPQMVQDVGVNTSDLDRYIWIVSGYLIAYIVAIPIVGRISDLVGRRNTYLGCLALFVAGSVVCALATDLTSLVVGRSIQGFGGGGLLPITLALAVDVLPPGRRLAGIGVVSAADTLGWVIGPLYGAAIESAAPGDSPWRWVFWINVPIVAAVTVFIVRHMPRDNREKERGRLRQFDIPGALLLTGAIVAANLALSAGGEIGSATGSGLRALGGTPNPMAKYTFPLLAIAAVFVVALTVVQRIVQHPILPMTLFRQRSFRLAMIANALVGVVLMVAMVDVPVAVNLIASPRWATAASAGMLATYTIGIMAATLLSDRITHRFGLLPVMGIGLVLAAGGYALLHALLGNGHLMRMVPGLVLAGFGVGLTLPPLSGLTVTHASEGDRGAASAMMLVSRLLGMTTGMSALTAVAVKRLQVLTERVPPIVRDPNESTAQFLERQRQFLTDTAFPLSIQVLGETFLIAAVLAVVAAIPALLLARAANSDE
ncbi:MAG: MFS transporter [Thermomicrobiales bacterium]